MTTSDTEDQNKQIIAAVTADTQTIERLANEIEETRKSVIVKPPESGNLPIVDMAIGRDVDKESIRVRVLLDTGSSIPIIDQELPEGAFLSSSLATTDSPHTAPPVAQKSPSQR